MVVVYEPTNKRSRSPLREAVRSSYLSLICVIIVHFVSLLCISCNVVQVHTHFIDGPSGCQGFEVDRHPEACINTFGSKSDGLKSKDEIIHFLSSTPPTNDFLIRGWRWHTMALIREARLLGQFFQNVRVDDPQRIQKQVESLNAASSYIVDFNMKALHRIENDLFFPWLKDQLRTKMAPTHKHVTDALLEVIAELEFDQKSVANYGQSFLNAVRIASHNQSSSNMISDSLTTMANQAGNIVVLSNSILQRQQDLLIPAMMRVIPEKEQRAFNARVIQSMGILDSRLHLVGMHEAILASQDKTESMLFDQDIPYIPRAMIPRWKRLLYQPKFGNLLDDVTVGSTASSPR